MPSKILKSPINGTVMEAVILNDGLSAFRCKTSGGHYIPAQCYMEWLERQPARLPHIPKADSSITPDTDSTRTLTCPESGTLMSRYKVGHGFNFTIDRSITGGIWLDRGEWESLENRNFHDEINLIFTAPWQKHIRDQHAHATYEDHLKDALGNDLFESLDHLRQQLSNHPHKNLALSFLSSGATAP